MSFLDNYPLNLQFVKLFIYQFIVQSSCERFRHILLLPCKLSFCRRSCCLRLLYGRHSTDLLSRSRDSIFVVDVPLKFVTPKVLNARLLICYSIQSKPPHYFDFGPWTGLNVRAGLNWMDRTDGRTDRTDGRTDRTELDPTD